MLRPRLRDGLNFSVQEQGGGASCVIEDTATSRFFRVGVEELRFFRSLDGSRTVASILAGLARDRGGDSFTEQEALQMLRWLKDSDLLAVESGRAEGAEAGARRAWRSAVTWLNPLVVRVPLCRPDRFFHLAARMLRPLLGRAGFAIWLAAVLMGVSQVADGWARFSRGFDGIIARDNWLWLGAVWVGMKVFHECGHGVFCRHFGARVREAGAIFVVFVPMGYVDATASLGIASRWRRIAVSCAGMYVEFFLAAVAAMIWSATPDGRAATVLHNAVVMGSVVTFFFNANPLMRFDGYFIASDLLGIPNLATRGRAWFTQAASWLIVGGQRLRPAVPASREEWFVALHGCAAWAWQCVVIAGLMLGASVLFRGGGLLLALLAGLVWVMAPLAKFVRQLALHARGRAGRVCVRISFTAALTLGLFLAPYRKVVIAPGVVEFGDTRIVRAECPGFVAAIHVRDGDAVAAGALLVELRNEEAVAALEKSRRELAAQELRARVAYTRNDVAEYQAEFARAEALRKTLAEHESYTATLRITSPIAGRVHARDLARTTGAWFGRGAEILQVGESAGREVKLAVAQDAQPHFKPALDRALSVRIEGRGVVLPARLERIDDSASRKLPHPALSALAGGPLPVRRTMEDDTAGAKPAHSHELADPHFSATVRLGGPDAAALNDGELARVRFKSPVKVTLWGETQAAVARWLRRYGA